MLLHKTITLSYRLKQANALKYQIISNDLIALRVDAPVECCWYSEAHSLPRYEV